MADDDLYIWVVRWEEFQHYKPERDRPPAWIKDYTNQLNDERYLRLSDRQRAVLVDTRRVHAMNRLRTRCDAAVIARHRHRRTRYSDLEALRDAGFIEFISRATLEKRLEKFYSRSRAEKEGEGEGDTPISPREVGTLSNQNPRAAGTNPRALAKNDKEQAHQELLKWTTQLAQTWNGKDSLAFDEALDQLEHDLQSQLSFSERDDLWNQAFST